MARRMAHLLFYKATYTYGYFFCNRTVQLTVVLPMGGQMVDPYIKDKALGVTIHW